MMHRKIHGILGLALLSGFACSAPSTNPEQTHRTIRGSLSLTDFSMEEARVIARSADGQSWRAPVRDDGHFAISVPVDQTYVFVFANSTTQPNFYDTFAILMHRSGDGSVHRNVRVTRGDDFDLGRVSPVGLESSTQGLSVASDDVDSDSESEDTDEDSDGDSDSDSSSVDTGQQDDALTACDASSGADVVPVEGENNLMGGTDADEDGVADDADSDDCDSDSDGDSDSDSDSDSDGDSVGTSSVADDSDSDSDSVGTSSVADDSDSDSDSDGDSDSDSEATAGLNCEDAASPMEEACESASTEMPPPAPGGSPSGENDPNVGASGTGGDGSSCTDPTNCV